MGLDIEKIRTLDAYNSNPEYYTQRFDGFAHHHQKTLERFLSTFKEKARILDLGSGAGTYALKIRDAGHDVVCVDNSEGMINVCKLRGLASTCMDIEDLTLPKNSFDGVWAMASIIHLPKQKLKSALYGIKNVMRDNATLYVGAHEGKDNNLIEERNFPGKYRHFSAFTEGEIEELTSGIFSKEDYWKTEGANNIFFLNYIFRKT